jgi:hypothetical protein
VTRKGDKLVFVSGALGAANPGAELFVYPLQAPPPELPPRFCRITVPSGTFSSPSWSPRRPSKSHVGSILMSSDRDRVQAVVLPMRRVQFAQANTRSTPGRPPAAAVAPPEACGQQLDDARDDERRGRHHPGQASDPTAIAFALHAAPRFPLARGEGICR